MTPTPGFLVTRPIVLVWGVSSVHIPDAPREEGVDDEGDPRTNGGGDIPCRYCTDPEE